MAISTKDQPRNAGPTAAQKMLGTVELMEAVLLDISPAQLLQLCKADAIWKAITAASPALQRSLFLQPEMATEAWIFKKTAMQDQPPACEFEYDVLPMFVDLVERKPAKDILPQDEAWVRAKLNRFLCSPISPVVTAPTTASWYFDWGEPPAPRETDHATLYRSLLDSWCHGTADAVELGMYLCQPPTESVVVRIERTRRGSNAPQHDSGVVANAEGVRLGDVLRRVDQLCPAMRREKMRSMQSGRSPLGGERVTLAFPRARYAEVQVPKEKMTAESERKWRREDELLQEQIGCHDVIFPWAGVQEIVKDLFIRV